MLIVLLFALPFLVPVFKHQLYSMFYYTVDHVCCTDYSYIQYKFPRGPRLTTCEVQNVSAVNIVTFTIS